jgi:hypothetical protein
LPINSNLPLSANLEDELAAGRVCALAHAVVVPRTQALAAFLESHPAVAPVLHVAGAARLVDQRGQPVLNGLGQRGQYPCSTLREQRASLLDQKTVLFVTWSHDRPA